MVSDAQALSALELALVIGGDASGGGGGGCQMI